jgi:hypothetical protein
MAGEMMSADLAQCIETIEAGYEYMLAYAAQGYEASQAAAQPSDILSHLTGMEQALGQLSDAASAAADAVGSDVSRYEAFLSALTDDAAKSRGAIRLVLTREASGISSQLVDNLNATIHLRALLTDLFLLDEALKG